jgi:DNA polymerase II small subunit
MRDHIVAYFAEHHKLVEADALRRLMEAPQPLVLSHRVIEAAGPSNPVVTGEMVDRLARESRAAPIPGARAPALPPTLVPNEAVPFTLIAEGFSPPTAGAAPLQAYAELFASRYRQIGRILRGRPDLPGQRPVAELRRSEGTVSVVAMVREVRQTPEKHHFIVRIEDEGGALDVLIPRDSPAARGTLLQDEMVGMTLALSKERDRIPRVISVVHPEVPMSRSPRRASKAHRVLILSDLHIGSRSFLGERWAELIDFLKGAGPRPDIAAEIAHVVIAGDLVDGIGIYPNQERDLAIHDIIEQYRELAHRLSDLPKHLNIVVLPGNHDAVCPAEPQPALPPELKGELPGNVRSVGNPATFALDGVVIEAYHGRSFDDLIPALPGTSYARATEVMKRMLAMRHLAPSYGGRTPLAPLARDGLVIDPAPDILVTGHSHTYGVDQYRGVLLVNASTWQSETDYQRMRNVVPVPARAAVVDLRDLSVTNLDFSGAPAADGEARA